VVFSFATQAHALTQADLDAAVLLVKGQNGVNGQSTELICPSGTCTTTPEPVSIALVGTGMVGLAVLRRRRKPRIGGEGLS
jgi:hypothetical protein